jgi:cobyric acid synthase
LFAPGLCLIPAETTLVAEKTTAVRTATTASGVSFGGYEIHLGITTLDPGAEPFAITDDGRPEGVVADRIVGTYLHGALESAEVCADLFGVPLDHVAPRRDAYERLADWLDHNGRGLAQLDLLS